MDSIWEKFGIYDFMGIWWPGAISVTYFWFTLDGKIQAAFDYMGIEIPINTEKYKLIILYSVVAYAIGIILHEIGKILADKTVCFKSTSLVECLACKQKCKGFGSSIRKENEKILREAVGDIDYEKVNFEKAVGKLKFSKDIDTRRIDKYHSVYGMSRGFALCCFFHVVAVCVIFFCSQEVAKGSLLLCLIDVAMILLFVKRAYRYFCAWVTNVLIQYYE